MLERTLVILTLALLSLCQKKEIKEERHVSYSREIQPIIATHCLSCHSGTENDTGYQISLSHPEIPENFSFPHPSESVMPEGEMTLLSKWLGQGSTVNQHWSFSELNTQPPFTPPLGATAPATAMPKGDFREFLKKTLAGDLLSKNGTKMENINKLDALTTQLIQLNWNASALSDLLLSPIDASVSE